MWTGRVAFGSNLAMEIPPYSGTNSSVNSKSQIKQQEAGGLGRIRMVVLRKLKRKYIVKVKSNHRAGTYLDSWSCCGFLEGSEAKCIRKYCENTWNLWISPE